MAKVITLICDKENAATFVDKLREHQLPKPNYYKINNQTVYIGYEPDMERVIRGKHSAIVHVKAADRPVPDKLRDALPMIPKDYTYTYNGEPPLVFVQG